MANKERGEHSVVVDGQSYTLRPSFDALCELEHLVDRGIDEVFAEVRTGRLSGLRSVIWCLLQDEHASEIRTLKDASRWVEAVGGADVAIEIVNKVLGLNVADDNGSGGVPNPPRAQAGIGGDSSSVRAESV